MAAVAAAVAAPRVCYFVIDLTINSLDSRTTKSKKAMDQSEPDASSQNVNYFWS